VGLDDAEIIGDSQRTLQAAVDYVAGLGGGTVEIGPGEYLMHDSLHVRPHVTVRGVRGKTILRKAKAAVSPLGVDGDYGEEQITIINPEGFDVGSGVAIRDKRSGVFTSPWRGSLDRAGTGSRSIRSSDPITWSGREPKRSPFFPS
jgi:polygalacturonase